MVGSVSAKKASAAEHVNRSYIENAVKNHVLLDAMIERGVLDQDSLPALEPTGHKPGARRIGSDGVSVQRVERDGIIQHRVSIVVQTDEYATQLFLHPVSDDYAIVESKNNGELYVFDASNNDVEPSGCYEMSGYTCTSGFNCGSTQLEKYERMWCTQFQECIKGDYLGCTYVGDPGCQDC